jgi:hypothetical protein
MKEELTIHLGLIVSFFGDKVAKGDTTSQILGETSLFLISKNSSNLFFPLFFLYLGSMTSQVCLLAIV